MNKFLGSAVGIGLGMWVAAATASPIVPSAYTFQSTVVSDTGFLDYAGPDATSSATPDSYFALDDGGILVLSGQPSDDSTAFLTLDFNLDFVPEVDILGAAGSNNTASMLEYFFTVSNMGYLVTVFLSEPLLTSDADLFGEPAAITVATYTSDSTPVIPLPASLPLMLAGLAGLVALRRRKPES